MLFTRECDYAVRIVRALSTGEIVNISTICQMEQMTTAIAYKVARKLEKAGMIKSYRGSAGGYALSCDLQSTTLYDIFSVIDSKLFLTDCMQPGYSCPLHTQQKPCLVHRELCLIQNRLNQDLKAKSLADILHG